MKLSELKSGGRSVLSEMGKQPEEYDGSFFCTNKALTSLKGSPKKVDNNFYCFRNKLTSLKGGPEVVNGEYVCSFNRLTSLESIATKIGDDLDCSYNNLTSLKNIHQQIKEIGGTANFDINPIKSHVLGLLKIKKLKNVKLDDKFVQDIINKYLPEGNIFDCQEELIEAGYEEYAQL